MKKVVDTDGNEYENEEAFLTHVLDVVGKHLKKFGEMARDEWRKELCWWDEEMDRRLERGDISESVHERFVDFLYGQLKQLNTHIW